MIYKANIFITNNDIFKDNNCLLNKYFYILDSRNTYET